MAEKNNQHIGSSSKSSGMKIIIGTIIVLLLISIGYFTIKKDEKEQVIKEPQVKREMPVQKIEVKKEVKPAINYDDLKKDEDLQKKMQDRKKKYDLKNSLDMIVDSDETFKINNKEVSMAEILKRAAIKRGEVVEENIGDAEVNPDIKQYGIYVVKPGDNIWNIHFNILKEYYELKNISLDVRADEPDKQGFSSGVGKILKFSETMVIIYNLEEGTIDSDINIIEPLTKIIVYNMTEIFSLLNDINYENVSKLQFDGKTIWIATDK